MQNEVLKFVALAFLKPEHVGQGFEALCEDKYVKKHISAFKPFLEYFEPQWVGVKRTQRRGKTGARVSWNCYHAALKGEMKTTSTLEVSHKYMKSIFGMKPKFNTFYDRLKVQQLKTISAIKDMENRAPKKKKDQQGQ